MSLLLTRIAEFRGVPEPGDDLFLADASTGKPITARKPIDSYK